MSDDDAEYAAFKKRYARIVGIVRIVRKEWGTDERMMRRCWENAVAMNRARIAAAKQETDK